jgi:hypothetical protein
MPKQRSIKPTGKKKPKQKPFKVMLYDSFERIWIDLGKGHDFVSQTRAFSKRDELNKKEFKTLTPSRDHYGVMRMNKTGTKGSEISCVC